MSSKSILEVRLSSFESKVSSSHTRRWELEWQLASRNLELNTATVELESTKRHLRLAEDAVSLLPEQVQNQVPQLREVDATVLGAKVALIAAESSVQLLTASESVMCGEAGQVSRGVGELGDKVGKMRQELSGKV